MPKRSIYLFSISSHPEAIHINPLDITFFQPQIDFSVYDYLIITSKQAVEALKQYDLKAFGVKKALCVSRASAKSYGQLGAEVLEIGKGYGETLLTTIKKYPKKVRWLYLRGEEVASDFATLAREDGYLIDEAVVYSSRCSKAIQEVQVSVDGILIFTSPSSVKCFLASHSLSKEQSIIVIGNTTRKAFAQEQEVVVAPEVTIESCIKEARKLR